MLNTSSGDGIVSPFDPPDSTPDLPISKASSHPLSGSADGSHSLEEILSNPWRNLPAFTRSNATTSALLDHAGPISPLRDRDIAALCSLFDRTDISEVERDINHQLIRLFPEPYWDQAELEFLRDHL